MGEANRANIIGGYFADNVAKNGGGLFIDNRVTLTETAIINNAARGSGGGLYSRIVTPVNRCNLAAVADAAKMLILVG